MAKLFALPKVVWPNLSLDAFRSPLRNKYKIGRIGKYVKKENIRLMLEVFCEYCMKEKVNKKETNNIYRSVRT